MNMRDMGRALWHGGGWLVSMQHVCLHDCAAFAIWYVLTTGGVVVALCTFCDALSSPMNTGGDAPFCAVGPRFGITRVPPPCMHCILVVAYMKRCGTVVCTAGVTGVPRTQGDVTMVHPPAGRLDYPSRSTLAD